MKKKLPLLSVVLATYQEAHNLEKCLVAVKRVADEVVVVDGSSPDGTAELAKKLGVDTIISTTNKPNFHINKQMAMDAATGALILQLDADEVLDQELISFITMIKKSLASEKDREKWIKEGNPVAWFINRRNYFLGLFLTKGGQYPDPVIRLYINGYAWLPQKDVHEQMKTKGSVGTALGHILHYANPTFDDYLRKFNTYTSFKAQQLKDENIEVTFTNALYYIVWLPFKTFFLLALRHKGIVDGIPGLVFALMSGLHHAAAFLKLWELSVSTKK